MFKPYVNDDLEIGRALLGASPHCHWVVASANSPVAAIAVLTTSSTWIHALNDVDSLTIDGAKLEASIELDPERCLELGGQCITATEIRDAVLKTETSDSTRLRKPRLYVPPESVPPKAVPPETTATNSHGENVRSIEDDSADRTIHKERRPAVLPPETRRASLGRLLMAVADQSTDTSTNTAGDAA